MRNREYSIVSYGHYTLGEIVDEILTATRLDDDGIVTAPRLGWDSTPQEKNIALRRAIQRGPILQDDILDWAASLAEDLCRTVQAINEKRKADQKEATPEASLWFLQLPCLFALELEQLQRLDTNGDMYFELTDDCRLVAHIPQENCPTSTELVVLYPGSHGLSPDESVQFIWVSEEQVIGMDSPQPEGDAYSVVTAGYVIRHSVNPNDSNFLPIEAMEVCSGQFDDGPIPEEETPSEEEEPCPPAKATPDRPEIVLPSLSQGQPVPPLKQHASTEWFMQGAEAQPTPIPEPEAAPDGPLAKEPLCTSAAPEPPKPAATTPAADCWW